ncbi:hypothetical protein EV127DRAFT_182145 [Xylaria flabelliformis]|nr:hypothetical protein EV127DRAFT_182145 [Xylaria flabelliformis]
MWCAVSRSSTPNVFWKYKYRRAWRPIPGTLMIQLDVRCIPCVRLHEKQRTCLLLQIPFTLPSRLQLGIQDYRKSGWVQVVIRPEHSSTRLETFESCHRYTGLTILLPRNELKVAYQSTSEFRSHTLLRYVEPTLDRSCATQSYHCVTGTALFVNVTILLLEKMSHTSITTTNPGVMCTIVCIIASHVFLYLSMLPLFFQMRSATDRTIIVLTVYDNLTSELAATLPWRSDALTRLSIYTLICSGGPRFGCGDLR